MKKILILGMSGMLGSMLYDYFRRHNIGEVKGTLRREVDLPPAVNMEDVFFFDAQKDSLEEVIYPYFKPDFIINGIGIIKPYCKDDDMKGVVDAVRVNALFPHLLSESARKIGARVIQIATDCVYSGIKGNYLESDPHDPLDVYGKTKSLGEVKDPLFLNIRCSIIGPERKNNLSLLEWFLSRETDQPQSGFTHHVWNGVTTLQFAQICAEIIQSGTERFDELVKVSTVHLVLNKTVNKYELLNIFNEVFDKGLKINPVDNVGQAIDRSIGTNYSFFKKELLEMKEPIFELKQYMELSETWKQ